MVATLMTMNRIPKEELESFNLDVFPDILSISLWVMEYLSDENTDRFGAAEISRYIVEELGISASRQKVHVALTGAVKSKWCHKENGKFKLMKRGQDELLNLMREDRVTLLEPGKPFSAGIELGNIFSQFSGVARFTDPYLDEKTLEIIHKHFANRKQSIKILTSKITNPTLVKSDLNKLIVEGMNIEVRKIGKNILHDRYFIDDRHIWLSGNSINNLGNKESFIVMLGDDIRQSVLQSFNSRWQSAITI